MRLFGAPRRDALNEALHELRRPFQALVLSVEPGRPAAGGVESSLFLVSAALDRLDEEINGSGTGGLRAGSGAPVARVGGRALAGARSHDRRRARACRGDGARPRRRSGPDLAGARQPDRQRDRARWAGGGGRCPEAWPSDRDHGHRLRTRDRPPSRRGSPGEVLARLTGRARRGHGLSVVRQVAAAHHGCFDLRRSEQGSVATLELPVAPRGA